KIDLTKNEYRILQLLMENKGRIVSRESLMNRLWETDSYVDENTLTVNVTRLRKKLEKSGLENFIATKVGMGYIIE
ncbi:MAG: winged helix-turn-helix domain-containing protein, partial [Oscillospiraceae bacterium]|nr:winged helix-turn-helix domain-containing protein [Oscillospiraceae bacterium]